MLIFVEVGQPCVGAVAVGWQRILRLAGFPGVQLGRHRRCRAFFSRHAWSVSNCNSYSALPWGDFSSRILCFSTFLRDLKGQVAKLGLNMAQHGPNIGPTWANIGPTCAQYGRNMPQHRPDIGPTWAQKRPTCLNIGPTAEHVPNTAQHRANIGPT